MAKNDIWVTAKGKRMKMCEMSDTHLSRALNYFKGRSGYEERWDLLTTELKRREKANEPPDEPIDSRFDILDL